jgi:RNA polymerase sigma factor for flagellar operon FliA
MGYLRDAIAELPDRARHVVTGYYLENRQLTELAADLGVTQSRASQLRSEALDLLHEALSRLLVDDASAGRRPTTDGATPAADGAAPAADGVRARRRQEYVQAVARRSSMRDRADVQAYLAGASLRAPGQGYGRAYDSRGGDGSGDGGRFDDRGFTPVEPDRSLNTA